MRKNKKALKTVDLCAGIGGMRRGFELAGGFKNVISAEIDTYACKTYEHLFRENPKNDVRSESFKRKVKKLGCDVLLAGFPCQAFSRAGKQHGFEDDTRGTIFFEIAKIIKRTRPKAFLLENVDHLFTHDNRNTFSRIIEVLVKELKYKVVGVNDVDGHLCYERVNFVRNSKNFGVPQNRPRIYLMGFDRKVFGDAVDLLHDKLPEKRELPIYPSLNDILEESICEKYFMSEGYLTTLEKHACRQKANGNGFGYRIVNSPEIANPVANTVMATGGSGKERNLIYDPMNGAQHGGKVVKGKRSPTNTKNIRVMTPLEWGRLQGFYGYGFMKNGIDTFSFPEDMKDGQRYKQFGNAVTIPVIEEMARFMKKCLSSLNRRKKGGKGVK